MKPFLNKLILWLRNLILDDADKEYEDALPDPKKIDFKKDPVARIQKRFNEQKGHNRR